jgi:NhaP-type Na+/H+ and K+/H+ antiporter
MIKLKIKNDASKIAILGLQGSGKTYFTKKILQIYKKPVVFQINKDDNYQENKKVLVYQAESQKEFWKFINFVKPILKEQAIYKKIKIDCIVIDEADLFIHNNFLVNANDDFNDLISNHRHYKVSLIFISRRPQDISAKVLESCKHIIIFPLQGANAKKKLEAIYLGMGRMSYKLKYKEYSFIYKKIGEEPKIYPKIK